MTAQAVRANQDKKDWLRLIRSENVGPITFHALLQRFGSAGAAIEAIPDLARRGGLRRAVRLCSAADARAELTRLAACQGRMIAWGEPDYPAALATLPDAPPLLAVRGQADVLARPMVAIVGARNASANGMRIAQELAAAIAREGFTVVSGLARGIDSAAHRGALPEGTVAVMAGGVDVVYPPENSALCDTLLARGAAVSEIALGTHPTAGYFPRRNRLASGLALGVVVEAALRSGSLITARLAAEQGREVFAVPGSPLDPRSRWTNNLLREGATLCETVEDVVTVLAPMLPRHATPLADMTPTEDTDACSEAGNDDPRQVLEHLGPQPTDIDEIVRQTGLPAPVVITAVLELELAGQVVRLPGNKVRRA